jgi:hypothetical protein
MLRRSGEDASDSRLTCLADQRACVALLLTFLDRRIVELDLARVSEKHSANVSRCCREIRSGS